jgi:uncharacterized protein YdhG (YjbR/CyaY superfamily)
MIDGTSTIAFFAGLPPERQGGMLALRRMILEAWPNAGETLVNGSPAYALDGHPFLVLANRKNYIAFQVVPHDLLNVFRTELRKYDHGRSCIRFKRLNDELAELLHRIIVYTGNQLHTSIHCTPVALPVEQS